MTRTLRDYDWLLRGSWKKRHLLEKSEVYQRSVSHRRSWVRKSNDCGKMKKETNQNLGKDASVHVIRTSVKATCAE